MSNPSCNHHYVPQFYLRRFARDDGKVLNTFRGDDGNLMEEWRGVKSTGSSDGLYSYQKEAPFATPWPEDGLEQGFFGELDREGAEAYRVVRASADQVMPSERRAWSRWIHSLVLRGPGSLAQRRQRLGQIATETWCEFIEEAGEGSSATRMTDVLEKMHVDSFVSNVTLGRMAQDVDDPKVLDILDSRRFVVVRNHTFQMLTGDNPVVMNVDDGDCLVYYSIALTPEELLIAHAPSWEADAQDIKSILAIHNIALLKQVTCVYSKSKLTDGVPVRTRTAAMELLPCLPWRRT